MGGRKKMTEKRDWSDSRKGRKLKSAGSLKLKKKKKWGNKFSTEKPSEKIHPPRHFDFRLLTSKTVREYICVVVSH